MRAKVCEFLKMIKLISIIMIFSSCSLGYRINYIASYHIQNKQIANDKKDNTIKIINQLAEKYKIQKDDKYKGLDTIGFFGVPYHYFKFVITNKDSAITNITLDYDGVFGKRKNPPYKQLISDFTDSIQSNFNVIKQEIKSDSNERK